MTGKKVFLSKNSLSVINVLQSTRNNTTELVSGPDNKRYVLKTFHKNTKEAGIERKYFQENRGKKFKVLKLPELVNYGADYMLVSYVDRDHYTRESIQGHEWIPSDIDRFHTGLCEFQSTIVSPGWFPIRKILIGFAYPAVFIFLNIPKCIRYGILHFGALSKLSGLALLYLAIRPAFRNKATHYDLTTYNYAFSGSDRMSMLDFDLSYYLGDPLYDAAYYVTIPPVKITEWTFQKNIINRQLEEHGKSWAVMQRLRLILVVTCINRYMYFKDDHKTRKIYKTNIQYLLDNNKFNNFIEQRVN